MKRAIVLSGGGSKGSYQIGVWKALRRLGIKYDIVTGTSVGSLNGALMTQKTFLKGVWFWYNLGFKSIFKQDLLYDYNTKEGRKAIYKEYAKAILIDKGMDPSKLEENIKKILSENKIRKSNVDFGFVTYNLSGLKPIMIKKSEVPNGKMCDYLMASATCFPAFKKKHIGMDDYIDGGYYDVLPINLAVEMGATEIIAIDLKSIGIKHRIKDKNIKITYISPRNNLESFLIFNKCLARRGIRLGYNDTMKTFGKLDGNKYTFKHNDISNNNAKYGSTYIKILNNVLDDKDNNIIVQLLKKTAYKKDEQAGNLINVIDFVGHVFGIDDSFIYYINRFNKKLIQQISTIDGIDEKKLENNHTRGFINSRKIIKDTYDKLMEDDSKTKKELSSMALLLPREFLASIYLYVITKK
ncbi:MAG: patatin-like phospholipase family protein [Bacilli bacterium]